VGDGKGDTGRATPTDGTTSGDNERGVWRVGGLGVALSESRTAQLAAPIKIISIRIR